MKVVGGLKHFYYGIPGRSRELFGICRKQLDGTEVKLVGIYLRKQPVIPLYVGMNAHTVFKDLLYFLYAALLIKSVSPQIEILDQLKEVFVTGGEIVQIGYTVLKL